MDKFLGAFVVIVLIATALTLMGLSWQRRQRRDIAVLVASTDASRGVRVLSIPCFYVATTPREQPLERLAIPGLAYRARATVSIETSGVLIEPAGEHPTMIDHSRIRGVRLADATIDRSAGRGSLVSIDWHAANGDEISSFLRIPRRLDRSVFVDAVNELLNPQIARTTPTKKERKQ